MPSSFIEKRPYYGALTLKRYVGRNAAGFEQYACVCKCGATVIRTKAQLQVRKLQVCESCHRAHVSKVLEEKRRERRKHANRQPACQDW